MWLVDVNSLHVARSADPVATILNQGTLLGIQETRALLICDTQWTVLLEYLSGSR